MIYRYGGPHMRGYAKQAQNQPGVNGTIPPQGVPSQGMVPQQGGIPTQPQDPYVNIAIPTQPVEMGKSLESKRREEIVALLILMFLAVLLSFAAFIAVNVLRHFSGSIFKTVEENGISIDSLKSLSAIRNIRVGGRIAIGLMLGVALLSRGATTVLYAIVWGIADLVAVLVTISFFRNSVKKKPATILDVVAVIVSLFTIVVTVYMPYEIWTKGRESEYWIPGSENSVSLWVMLPAIIWSVYLFIYLICAIISALRERHNKANNHTEGSIS
ncbi:MAG: hypothetical protein J5636_01075 [Clostridiales bacterium]|nr:hypothetical protein [Clostridiales bacterium]